MKILLFACLTIGVVIILSQSFQVHSAQGISPLSADETDYTILLKSRTVIPSEGIDTSLLALPPAEYHVFIQFYSIPTESQKKEIEDLGAKILRYIPQNAYQAKIPSSEFSVIAGNKLVRAIFPILLFDKLEQSIKNGDYYPWAISNDSLLVNVQFFPDIPIEEAKSILEAFGTVQGENSLTNTLLAEIPFESLFSLAGLDPVEWIEQAPPQKEPELDQARARTGANTVQGAPFNLNGIGITIIQDEPQSPNKTHPDIAGRITINDLSCPQNSSHATQVAGVAIGNGFINNIFRGIATSALITHYCPNMDADVVINYTFAITNQGARLATNSWGYPLRATNCPTAGDYDATAQTYDSVINKTSLPVVFSVGNNRDTPCGTNVTLNPAAPYQTINRPHAAKNIIAVGATHSDDDTMTSFSNWGPVDDGRLKPELVAPGAQKGGDGGITMPNASVNFYLPGNGTSFAAPHVAGAIALVGRDWINNHPSGGFPRSATFKSLLAHTSLDLGNPGPDFSFGYGLVNASSAVRHERLDFTCKEAIIENSLSAGSPAKEFMIDVMPGMSELRATLSWDDPPAAVMAAVTLVNNLDLRLVAPNGTAFQPLILNPAAPASNAIPGNDNRNNLEQLPIKNPSSGTWTVRVIPTSIPHSPQTFSLILSCRANVTSTGIVGAEQKVFTEDEKVHTKGSKYPKNDDLTPVQVDLYVTVNSTLMNGDVLRDVTEGVESVVTDGQGSIPNTKIWDKPYRGLYNIVVDGNRNGRYEGDQDIIQNFTGGFGFRVHWVNSSNSTGKEKDVFSYEDVGNETSVYCNSSGLPNSSIVHIYVTADRLWKDGDSLVDVTSDGANSVNVTAEGVLALIPKLWADIKKNDSGLYDIVVDVNRDGKYNRGFDVVDGLSTLGFRIPYVNSTDRQGKEKDIFNLTNISKSSVYANASGLPNRTLVNIYVTLGRMWNDGDSLTDVSSDGVNSNISVNQLGVIGGIVKVWPEITKNNTGEYDIVVDVDRNGKFNRSIDVADGLRGTGFKIVVNQ